jgi:hypothetical protein
MTLFSRSLCLSLASRDAWRRRRKDVCRQQACAETCKDPGLAGFGGGRRGLGGAKGWAAQRRAEGVERGEKSVLTPQDDGGDCATAGD